MRTLSHTVEPSSSRRLGPVVAIVGAGIVGLAHAWAAAKRGCQVIVLERDAHARGASIRNFGMVWPIGQANGPNYRTAMQSRRLWDSFIERSGVWANPCGSLHVAYRPDEWEVIQEFVRLAPALGYICQLLSPEEAARLTPAVQRNGLLGALHSLSEMCVDPREAIGRAPVWLEQEYGVEFRFGAKVQTINEGRLIVADGADVLADRVVVAAGADLRDLYPDLYRLTGFQRCKLQMLRTVSQPANWRMGPMIAGGLTLRHYAAFSVCRSLIALKQRIAAETPELNRFGIHVMASQNELGEVVLGDSHEYGEEASPFDNLEIDDIILRELRRFLYLPDWTISQRWHGVYPKATDIVQLDAEPEPHVYVAIASGGAGMTMSFGLADQFWQSQLGDEIPSQFDAFPSRARVGASSHS